MAEDYPPLIPPGGGDGAPLGPGASMANSLQQVLAQRRAQSQQNLLNQLSQVKLAADIHHQQNEDAYNTESRSALADERHARAADRADIAARRERFGAVLKSITNQTVPATNPQQGPVQDPSDPTDPVAVSQKPVPLMSQFNPQEQAAFQILQAVGADDPKSPELVNALLSRFVKPDQEYEDERWFDEATKTSGLTGGKVKKGTPSIHFGINADQFRPPQPNEANTPHLIAVQAPDPDHPGKFRVETHWSAPTGAYVRPDFNQDRTKSKTFYAVGDVNKPGTPPRISTRPPIPLFTPKSAEDLANAQSKGPKTANAALQAFISQISNPYIRQDVMDLLGDQSKKRAGVDAAVEALVPPDGVDPDEYRNDFRRVMNIIRTTGQIK